MVLHFYNPFVKNAFYTIGIFFNQTLWIYSRIKELFKINDYTRDANFPLRFIYKSKRTLPGNIRRLGPGYHFLHQNFANLYT